MAIVETIFGLLFYLAVPVTLAGYWVTMRDARLGAGLMGFVVGLGFGLSIGNAAALGVGVVVAALAAVVAHQDDRLGWAVAAGATGALLGPFLTGGELGVVAGAGAIVLALALGALAWRFPRGTLPISTSVHGGLLALLVVATQGEAASAFAVDPNILHVTVILSAFVGLMIQPWTAEFGDVVPPLLPLTIRKWFDLVPEGGVADAMCPNCGESVHPTDPYCGNCDASLTGIVGPADGTTGSSAADGATGSSAADGATGSGAAPGSNSSTGTESGSPAGTAGGSSERSTTGSTTQGVPADAAAVDVPCPDCGERPIEEAAKGVGLLGLLIFYRWSTRTVVGCHKCTRSRLWRLAGKNFVLGWWSITALVNPFVILWNVGRGAVNRGPNQALATHLAQTGVDFEYLSDPSEFDSSAHAEHEVLLRGLLRLGTAVMLADGSADQKEATAIRDAALGLFPGEDPSRLEDRIQSYAQETTNVTTVAGGLQETLTEEGHEVALQFAADVAAADGTVRSAETDLLETIADELGLPDDAVDTALSSGERTAAATEHADAI